MGKTQLAFKYACQYREDYSAVFWLNSKDVDTLKRSFLRAAKRILRDHPSITHLQPIIKDEELDQAVEAVKNFLSKRNNTRWLLIFDNYDTPKLSPRSGDPAEFSIQAFFPDTYHGAIIITTRSHSLKLGHQISVQKFREFEDSLRLLSHTSGRRDLHKGKRHCFHQLLCFTLPNIRSRRWRCDACYPIGWATSCFDHRWCLSLPGHNQLRRLS